MHLHQHGVFISEEDGVLLELLLLLAGCPNTLAEALTMPEAESQLDEAAEQVVAAVGCPLQFSCTKGPLLVKHPYAQSTRG